MKPIYSRIALVAATALSPLFAMSPLAPRAASAQNAVAAASVADAAPHTFTFVNADARTVHVAGTFNNWDKNALPMTKDADGKTWRVTASVPYGKQQYKFVVNGETWVPDPHAAKEDDGGGNQNSVLTVTPPDYATPAKIGDGVVTKSAVSHSTVAPYFNYDRGNLSLSLRARPNDVANVSVLVGGKRIPLVKQTEDALYARYRALVPWDRKADLSYSFELKDGATTVRYGADGLAATPKPFVVDAKTYKPFVVPGWVEKTVFYQIFPDRFENGDTRNDPKDVQAWNAKPQYFNRFGGDVAGVEKHVDHLAGLGVGAVYFNPVFQSPSNHRYDATDFRKIDRDFGTNDEFKQLTKSLDKRGIRTVMDFVFNHSATDFFAFQDVRDKGVASAYKDWYFVKSYPVKVADNPNYEAWYGFPSMPKMNVLNPATRDYLLSLVDFWTTEVPLSGMRLDVANEVAPQFWRNLRTKAKATNPDLWIVGEVWGDGSPWLGGDQWDSVMNYQFRDACLRFFAEERTTPTQFTNRLTALDASYAPQVSRNMMNLLSSHDTPRFLTLCKNDAAMHRLAALVQFTWVGAPSIYYGEEIGMEGGTDPDNRRGMTWDKANPQNEMLTYYKKLVSLRNKSAALQSGDATILATNDAEGTFAYARVLGKDAAVVAVNRSREPRTVRVTVPASLKGAKLRDALTGNGVPVSGGVATVTLAPLSGAVVGR